MASPFMETLEAYQKRDPAARSKVEIALLYQGFHATVYHWCAHWLFTHKMPFLGRSISQWSRFWTGIEIHPGAKIGRRFVIDHGMGIVIGETAEIGDDVLLYHGVTLGGTGKDQGKRHPTIGNDVLIGCGAKILGPFTVGTGARIAANSVVLQEVPDHATAVGIPAQIVKVAGKTVSFAEEIDQVSVGDPAKEERESLDERIAKLEKQLLNMAHVSTYQNQTPYNTPKEDPLSIRTGIYLSQHSLPFNSEQRQVADFIYGTEQKKVPPKKTKKAKVTKNK